MFKVSWKNMLLMASLALVLVIAGCGGNNDKDNNKDNNSNNNASNEENNASNDATVDYSEEVDYKITGIEAGAGVFNAAETAVEEYGLDGWEVLASSSGAMTVELGEAIANEEPIIVTGWTPHWKFAEYDLKYLEDPKEVFGGEETINTVVREGFEDDAPNAFKLLDQFNWTTDDMEEVMLEISEGTSEEEAAANWIEKNEDKVAEWVEGVEEDSGENLELVYVTWDSEIASTNVVAQVLESHGIEVEMTPLDNAIMWQAIATGEADAMVAAWLPATHKDLYAEHKDDIVDLGPNLEGAKIGLVVPEYMDIDSIEDLQAK